MSVAGDGGAGDGGAGDGGVGDGAAGDGGADRHAADGAGDRSGRAHDDHTDGGGQTAFDEPAGAPAPSEPAPANVPAAAPPKTKTKPSLVESWESSPEDRAAIRDLVLEDYFALADGRNFLSRIHGVKRDVVIRDLLDALGVDGMLQAMSPEFGAQLRAKVPAIKPKFKTTIQAERTASGEFTVHPHGKRSGLH
jgi:hypothetical protein